MIKVIPFVRFQVYFFSFPKFLQMLEIFSYTSVMVKREILQSAELHGSAIVLTLTSVTSSIVSNDPFCTNCF